MSGKQQSPEEALERLFEVIRQEAAASPKFARRMFDAVSAPIVFTGTDAGVAADPIILASKGDHTQFMETFVTFAEADLKKMIKNYSLATAEDVKNAGKGQHKKHGLIDLMWSGAQRKLKERR
jgi:hypothetical protein